MAGWAGRWAQIVFFLFSTVGGRKSHLNCDAYGSVGTRAVHKPFPLFPRKLVNTKPETACRTALFAGGAGYNQPTNRTGNRLVPQRLWVGGRMEGWVRRKTKTPFFSLFFQQRQHRKSNIQNAFFLQGWIRMVSNSWCCFIRVVFCRRLVFFSHCRRLVFVLFSFYLCFQNAFFLQGWIRMVSNSWCCFIRVVFCRRLVFFSHFFRLGPCYNSASSCATFRSLFLFIIFLLARAAKVFATLKSNRSSSECGG